MGKKVLVTGVNGMLGGAIVDVFSDYDFELYGIDKEANATGSECDVRAIDLLDKVSVNNFLKKVEPDVIIHCAANVNLAACEEAKEKTHELHVGATKTLASYNPFNTKFIYISTDSVFDGIKGNYTEEDIPNPINYYAKTKKEGEDVALRTNLNTIVIRTNIYGFKMPFRNSLVEWAISLAEKGEVIKGFKDVFFNPLYTKQLANVIKLLINKDFKGIINAASSKPIDKYNFILELFKVFGFDTEKVEESSVKDVELKIDRPSNTTLNIEFLKFTLGEVPSLIDGLYGLKHDYDKENVDAL